jgi:hypothetical protein
MNLYSDVARTENYVYNKSDCGPENTYAEGDSIIAVKDKNKEKMRRKKNEMEKQEFACCEPFFYQNYWYILGVKRFE